MRRGDRVDLSQVIAQLDKTDFQLQLDVANAKLSHAETRAANLGEVAASKAAVARALTERKLMNELGDNAVFLEKFRIENTYQRTLAELETAENGLKQHQLSVQIEKNEVRVLENTIRQTSILSPVAGVVRELLKNQGEWANRGEPLLVITRMDRLLAEGFLDSTTCRVDSIIGATASVEFEIGNKQKVVIEGLKVTRAAPKLELDGKFPIWVEFDNREVTYPNNELGWLIRPGMRARITVRVPEMESRREEQNDVALVTPSLPKATVEK